MPQRVRAPDGSIAVFPDDMSDDDIARVMRREYGGPKASKNLFDEVAGFGANFNRGGAVGDELAAGFGVATGLLTGRHRFGADKPGNVVANNLGMLRDAYKSELAGQRAREKDFDTDRPRAAALARGTGMAATAVVPGGQTTNLFASGSRAVNAVRGATAAGLTGAAYSAADAGTLQERAGAAARTARDPLTLGLGAAGGAVAPARARTPKRRVAPEVERLRAEGVKLTPGQAVGGLAKVAEDAATSAPILGPAIQEARTEGLQTFNRAVVNRSLKPLGKQLPPEIQTGTDAVRYAGDELSSAYKRVLPEGKVVADQRMAAELRKLAPITQTMSREATENLQGIIAKRVTEATEQGALSGQRFKAVEQGLDYDIARYAKSGDPDHQATAEALKLVKAALQDAAMRQNPQFAKAKAAIDRGWAELVRIENAAGKAGAEGGVFTPAQYDAAVRGGDTRVRRRGYARGEALGQDIATDARKVLPSKVPDSGTGTRAALVGGTMHALGAGVGALTGGGVGAIGGVAATTGALAAGSRAYSPKAIDAFNRALDARIGQQEARMALAELRQMAEQNPAIMELYREALARLSRAAGVAGAAPQNLFAQP